MELMDAKAKELLKLRASEAPTQMNIDLNTGDENSDVETFFWKSFKAH